jgi:F-type H+-transporting ATPase subunit epsilon
MNKFRFQLITPEKIAFEDEIEEANLPTVEGEIGILPNHIPLLSILKAGEIRLKKGGEIVYLATSGGCIEVNPTGVRVLADSAERAEEIDEMRAIEAKNQAEKLMKEAADDVSFADATAYLERSLARIKVAGRKKKHH